MRATTVSCARRFHGGLCLGDVGHGCVVRSFIPGLRVDGLVTMMPRTRGSADAAALGIRSLGVGALVRVQCAAGDVWSANVTYVSGQLVGLRGWTRVDDTFRERDTVTLLIGHGDRLISANAQVLAAAGSLMRIVRRDASDEMDRRRAPRLRVDLTATLTLPEDHANPVPFEAEVVDLSTSGCAVRSATALALGTSVGITMDLNDAQVQLTGMVMRTWMDDLPPVAHAGIKFDLMSASATMLVNRFLVNQLQSDLSTR